MRKNELWITWNDSQRSRNLAKELNLPLYVKVIENNFINRHLLSSIWAIYILLKVRPDKIYLQYSFLLLVVVAGYKRLALYPVHVICDCHTKALRRSVRSYIGSIFWWLKKKSFRSVNISIVSNVEMVPDIKRLTASYYVLPDKIPTVITSDRRGMSDKYCVFVCSYAVDEPLDDVIAAAGKLDGSIKIYCTGAIPDELKGLMANPYKNIIFTDYLSQEQYYNLISNADCILALTSEDGCLQCAGYEALSAEVPVVLSDTTALRSYFENAAVYVKHDAQEIANGVQQAVDSNATLLGEMSQLKKVREYEYVTALNALVNAI